MRVRNWRGIVAPLALTALLAVTACTTEAAAFGADPDATDGVVVPTDKGVVHGAAKDGVRVFQRIPFAAPPVGPLRWRAPQPVAPWPGELDATKPGPACAQEPTEQPGGGVSSEDCLYLDVTAPAADPGKPKPVVVWVPGGAFIAGSGPGHDAKRWVERGDVIVVTVNYRLGMLGNLAYPGLADSGTFALRDQQAALAWVRRNIAAFGGNPGNVTLAGQSAGAMSACAQLTSPRAAGLFDKVIMQSGACEVSWLDNFDFRGKKASSVFLPRAEVERTGRQAAAELGCTGDPSAVLDCLRALDVEALKPVTNRFANPAYDTPTLPENPADALDHGKFHRVPVISGNVHDEGTLTTSTYDGGSPITEATYDAVLTETFGADRPLVDAEYPRAAYGSAAAAWADIVTDRKWLCTQYATSGRLARYTPVYQYEFADPAPPPMWPEPPKMPMGSFHSSELWSLFDFGGMTPPFTEAQRRLAEAIIDYWSDFARTGDPGWPGFQSSARPPYTQSLAPERIGAVDLAAEHHCDFWSRR